MNSLTSSFGFLILILCTILHAAEAIGQIPAGSSARRIPTDVEKSDPRVTQLIAKAEDHFRKGKLSLEDNKREQARNEFDKAIDTILESSLDVRANQRLHKFYLELIERIYREEVLIKHAQNPPSTSQGQPQKTQPPPQIGFLERRFEPSPLDELSKLVLSPEEQKVEVYLTKTEGLTNLPPRFSGENAQAIYGAISRQVKSLVKSQLETTPEYAARARSVVRAIRLPSGKTADDEITVVVSGVQFSYDADAGAATFRTYGSSCSLYTGIIAHYAKGVADEELGITEGELFLKCKAIELFSRSKTLGDAIGQNAFGVKVRYSRTSVNALLLAMPSDKAQAFQEGITFETNKSKATKMMRQASMAISGRLLYPYIAYQFGYTKPTIDSPYKISYDNHYIIFRPEKVRIFNRATGEVFALLELR